jgi:hypothetical protein
MGRPLQSSLENVRAGGCYALKFLVDFEVQLTDIAQVCAMSGEPPVEPVVSRKTGHMFEKRTILTYILESGTCPITGQPLSSDDLLELKGRFQTKNYFVVVIFLSHNNSYILKAFSL